MFGVKFSYYFTFFIFGILAFPHHTLAFEFSRQGLDDIMKSIKDPFGSYEDYCPKSPAANIQQAVCMADSQFITPKPDTLQDMGFSKDEIEEWLWIQEAVDRREQETKALFVKQGLIKKELKDKKSKENQQLRRSIYLATLAEAEIEKAKNCDSFFGTSQMCKQYSRTEWKTKLENAQKAKALILAEEPLLMHKDLDQLIRFQGKQSAFPMSGYKGYDVNSEEYTKALETAVTDRENYYKDLWNKYETLKKNEIQMGNLVNSSKNSDSSAQKDYSQLVRATVHDKAILVDLTESDPDKFKKLNDPLMFARCRLENRILKKESQKELGMFAANAFLAVTPMGLSAAALRASATLGRLAPLSSTVALGASDLAALKTQQNECKKLENKVVNESNGNKTQELQDCVETYKNQWFYSLLGIGGSALGTKLPGKLIASEQKNIKTVLPRELEEQFASLKNDRGSLSQPITRQDYDVLSQTPVDQKIQINFFGNSQGTKSSWMTPQELSTYMKQNPNAEFSVKGIASSGNPIDIAAVSDKFENNWIKAQMEADPTGIIEKTVYLKSGEAVTFSGNAERFAEIAKNPNVEKVTYEESKPWFRRLNEIPSEQQTSKFNVYSAKSSEIGENVSHFSQGSDISGMKIYHGTLDAYESSIRSGPKNVGKGFGGRGLYVAVEEDKEVAAGFAEMAKREAKSRLQQVDGVLSSPVDPKQTKAILMEGIINPNKNLKVARFQVNRNITQPDLKRGLLPTDWDSDPVLRKILEKEYDVLEITHMKSSGLALDTDRVLIIHERAGADAIIWNKVDRL